jgi:tripartite-type tricarboxylate transporter receptor subunit TctC
MIITNCHVSPTRWHGSEIKRLFLFFAVSFLTFISFGRDSYAQEAVFKGGTIRFIVGYSAGGLFDTYSRLIARHFGKHLPGDPTTIVENMTGAGGLISVNHVYTRAKPDGLTVGALSTPLILQHVMGNKAAEFDGRKFGYLGGPSSYDTVCAFNSQSGVKNMDDWYASKKPLKISATGPGTGPSDIPKLLKEALGLPIDLVEGYKGGSDARLAVDSGEVDGYCGGWQTVETVWRSALDSGKVRIVVQTGLKAHPDLKQVPLAIAYAKTPEARQLLEVADNAHGSQLAYIVPPGMADNRLKTLQKAFMDTVNDPALRAEAQKSKLEIGPMDGPTITKKLASLYELEPALIAKMRTILISPK